MSKEDIDKSKIEYREAKPEDAEGMLRVNLICWLDTYTNNDLGITKELIIKERGNPDNLDQEKISKWRERVQNFNYSSERKFWVAVYKNTIIGYAGVAKEEESYSIQGIYILPEYQRMGIGSKLLELILNYIKEGDLILSVANYNQKAINFYLKHGFEITNETHNFKIGKSNYYIPCTKIVRKAKT